MWFCEIDWIAVATVALVIVTGYYAFSTYKILGESQKTREATERLATSSEQANILLRQQIEEAAGVGSKVVRSAIRTALQYIDYWKRANIPDLASRNALPSKIDLVPSDAEVALHHAGRISPDGNVELLKAFNNLRFAQNEIEVLMADKMRDPGFIEEHSQRAIGFIDLAAAHLRSAEKYLF